MAEEKQAAPEELPVPRGGANKLTDHVETLCFLEGRGVPRQAHLDIDPETLVTNCGVCNRRNTHS